ncbi:uncharacterized protein M421DRAFT_95083 [Didymella exigua CBS 183.55]|uniref:Uncharacterized protein n=1 Tax=Didymella exigua CBS 183.55 TaxID=1150837 RepID=A0A6A5RC30_9PLEO|nr:uncharacterized protein M421DRAFT_95083 [Didymella exigua CBS 183.55]KAF1924939.1 hypothetical protein M421DRAFT_95083 [Didymella exigua CBS 183.55]
MCAAKTAHGTPEGPILSLAWDCDEYFQKFFKKTNTSSLPFRTRLDNYGLRFTAWREHLGVFAGPKADLDCQLQRHPEVQDIIVRLLLTLRRNLIQLDVDWELVLQSSSNHIIANRSWSQDAEGEHQDATNADNLLRGTFQAIDESLEQLHRVGTAIRQSARSTEIARARAYASAHLDLENFEAMALAALHLLYPNAAESLIVQLSESMKDRFAVIQYKASRQGVKSRDQRPLSRPKIEHRTHQEQVQKPQMIEHAVQPVQKTAVTHTVLSDNKPTTIGTCNLRERFKQIHTHRSRPSTTIAHIASTNEPTPPRFRDSNGAILACPWCSMKTSDELTKNGRWTDKGRRVVDYLKPFPCLSEKCIGLENSFATTSEWSAHMFKHDQLWAQHIHYSPMWICSQHPSPALFETDQHVDNHLTSMHQISSRGEVNLGESPAEMTFVDEHRGREVCPLCGFRLEGDIRPENMNKVPAPMIGHIADHLQILMNLSLRFIQLQERRDDQDKVSENGDSDQTVAVTENSQKPTDHPPLSPFPSSPASIVQEYSGTQSGEEEQETENDVRIDNSKLATDSIPSADESKPGSPSLWEPLSDSHSDETGPEGPAKIAQTTTLNTTMLRARKRPSASLEVSLVEAFERSNFFDPELD